MNALSSQLAPPPPQSSGPCRLEVGRMRSCLWAPDAAASGQPIRPEIAGKWPGPMCSAALGPGESEGRLEALAPCRPGARYWFRLDNDSTTPDPASRAQAADINGPSLFCDPHAYTWCHPHWHGRPWHEAVVYEMRVGLCGGYGCATRQQPRLAALGLMAVEPMPLSAFPGGRNWAYEGVLPFAPDGGLAHARQAARPAQRRVPAATAITRLDTLAHP